jgi:fructose-1,6-bisphosphatase/sedoheptulose 1,7-bisphosphatase-like protein
MSNGSPSFNSYIGPLIARASEVLTASKVNGDAVEGVVSLIVAARIIEADMLAMLTPGPDPVLMQKLEEETRKEIERIFTDGWARH